MKTTILASLLMFPWFGGKHKAETKQSYICYYSFSQDSLVNEGRAGRGLPSLHTYAKLENGKVVMYSEMRQVNVKEPWRFTDVVELGKCEFDHVVMGRR